MTLSRRDILKVGGLALLGSVVPSPALAAQSVRIAVGRFRHAIVLSGQDLELRTPTGTTLAKGSRFPLRADKRGMWLDGRRVDEGELFATGPVTLSLEGHQYHKRLEVSWRKYQGVPELLVVHPLPLETYVLGVVSSELPQRWPLEGLKVQAIAARTFAVWQKYRRLSLPYHMESTVLDQVYHGAQREHAAAERAVVETLGTVLTFGRRPAEAYFHAACGGRTESAAEGWGRALPYLPGSRCGFCGQANRYQWTERVPRSELDKAFAKLLGESVQELRVVSKTRSGRADQLEVRGAKRRAKLSGPDLRRLVGYNRVWSTYLLELEAGKTHFTFTGRGAGHGVGMCQWGAKGMADAGHHHDAILARYYPGASLTRMF